MPSETSLATSGPGPTEAPGLESGLDRRTDIDAKMTHVARILKETECEGLLLLDPANISWLSSGGTTRGNLEGREAPAIYCNGDARWAVCANTDTQRYFDEEIDGLGFQLKEWPYHWGREQLLADICQNRKVACDLPRGDCAPASDLLRRVRRRLTIYEQACMQAVGILVAHAVEATCRTMDPGLTEREIAGQIAHRLLHRGVQPVHVGVAADGRSRRYRQFGSTAATLKQFGVVTVTGIKYGLCATATRSLSFGPCDAEFRKDHNAVCKVGATYLASTWPDAVPREILLAGRRVYLLSGYEHEWGRASQGFLTGRAVVELPMLPTTEELFETGCAVTWTPSSGAGMGGDTFLISDNGPRLMTLTETWPLKRIRVQGAEFVQPDVLQR